jgi:beta-RFAP synthase
MEAFPAKPSHASEALASHQARVTTTARLHFGFLDPSGRSERPFGSFGLSLDQPCTRLTLARAETLVVEGPERERAERYLRSLAASFRFPKGHVLRIEEAIPPHAGLGSGTQLALAIGSAFGALGGLRLDPQDIASRLGRGTRSGIGIATFAHGGAVLDSGPEDGNLPHLVARVPFPRDWRVILVVDPALSGLAGASEMEAFDQLPDFPASERDTLHRRITQSALPALAASDFATFSKEVGYLQDCMGAYFARLQGGPYVSPRVAAALGWLDKQGVVGLGQSSWGPTGFAFVSSEAEGEALIGRLRGELSELGLRLALAKGRNEGAKIETSAAEIR